jgi:1,4-alpha-glucan branching enzyme
VSFTASLEGGAASSNMDSGRWTRVAAALLAEWRWERLGAAAGDAEAPRDVVLRVAEPGARQVAVAGTFTDWAPVELAPDGAGAFSGTVRAAPGEHRFGLLVDGAWTAPAGLPLRDDGLGGRDAVIVVPPP